MTNSRQSLRVKPAQTRKRRGRGSSEVFLEDARHWGAGTGHVYVKRQHDYSCRPPWRLFLKTPTLHRECRALNRCRRIGIDVPQVVAYREEGEYAQLVLKEIDDALPLDRALSEPDSDRVTIVGNVASVIGRLHSAGWVHGALYPDHILVGPGPHYQVTLIDLEKARQSRLKRSDDVNRLLRYTTALDSREVNVFRNHYKTTLKTVSSDQRNLFINNAMSRHKHGAFDLKRFISWVKSLI